MFDRIRSFFKNPCLRKSMAYKAPPMPEWGKIVEIMNEKRPDYFKDEVIEVICSKDRTMRCVILKDEKGFLTYVLEKIFVFDEEEWEYVSRSDGALPAMWNTVIGGGLFDSMTELLRELKAEPEYKLYF